MVSQKSESLCQHAHLLLYFIFILCRERLQNVGDIRTNIKDVLEVICLQYHNYIMSLICNLVHTYLQTVTSQMDKLDPKIPIGNEDNIPKLKYIQENIFTLPEYHTDFPMVCTYCPVLYNLLHYCTVLYVCMYVCLYVTVYVCICIYVLYNRKYLLESNFC